MEKEKEHNQFLLPTEQYENFFLDFQVKHSYE